MAGVLSSDRNTRRTPRIVKKFNAEHAEGAEEEELQAYYEVIKGEEMRRNLG